MQRFDVLFGITQLAMTLMMKNMLDVYFTKSRTQTILAFCFFRCYYWN